MTYKDDRHGGHVCHAKECTTTCDPKYLMCTPHWRMVPTRIRADVYEHYQPGQEKLEVMPTQEWHDAAQRAIDYVAAKEGK